MSEIFKIFLTSALTIVGGVIVYALSQIILKFIIEPIHGQKKIIGEIADALIFYGNIYCNPGIGPKEKIDEASEKLRQLATLLQSRTHLIPCYGFFEKIRIVNKTSAIKEASRNLIGLSNSVYKPPVGGWSPLEYAREIKKLLNLRIE